jgi:hypothetical protein
MKLGLSHITSKNNQISNFMKFRPVGAELFHADGQTDITQLMVVSQFPPQLRSRVGGHMSGSL